MHLTRPARVRNFFSKGEMMALDSNIARLLDQLDECGKADFAALAEALAEATYEGGVAAMAQSDPKKLGKEKKPDANLVGLVFPDQ